MVLTVSGIVTVASAPVYASRNPFPAITNSSVWLSSQGVPWTMPQPMSETVSGMEMRSSRVQSLKANSPILRMVSGRVTCFSRVQSLKA